MNNPRYFRLGDTIYELDTTRTVFSGEAAILRSGEFSYRIVPTETLDTFEEITEAEARTLAPDLFTT